MIPVIAYDLSLRRSGYATHVQLASGATDRRCGVIVPPGRDDPDRMLHIAGQVARHAHAAEARLVAFEGAAYAAKSSSTDRIGAMHWFARAALQRAGIPWIVVPPATIKQYATGNGAADKKAMVAAANYRLSWRGTDDNIADALHLHALVSDALGHGYVDELGWPTGRQRARQAIATVVAQLNTIDLAGAAP